MIDDFGNTTLEYRFGDMGNSQKIEMLVERINRLEAEVNLSSQEISALRNYIYNRSKVPPIQKAEDDRFSLSDFTDSMELGRTVERAKIIKIIDEMIDASPDRRDMVLGNLVNKGRRKSLESLKLTILEMAD